MSKPVDTISVRCAACDRRWQAESRRAPALAEMVKDSDGWSVLPLHRESRRSADEEHTNRVIAQLDQRIEVEEQTDGYNLEELRAQRDEIVSRGVRAETRTTPRPESILASDAELIVLPCRRCRHRPRLKFQRLAQLAQSAAAQGRRDVYL